MTIIQTASGITLTKELEKYSQRKAKQLGHIVPRQFRKDAVCQVEFTRKTTGNKKYNTCSVTLEVADTELKVTETTQHMYASLDVATVHMQHQLADYSARTRRHRLRHLLRG